MQTVRRKNETLWSPHIPFPRPDGVEHLAAEGYAYTRAVRLVGDHHGQRADLSMPAGGGIECGEGVTDACRIRSGDAPPGFIHLKATPRRMGKTRDGGGHSSATFRLKNGSTPDRQRSHSLVELLLF